MKNLHLLEYLSEAFRCHVHHYGGPFRAGCDGVRFRFIGVGMAYMSGMCDCIKECVSFEM